MPFLSCCCRPERDLDAAFRALPPGYSEKGNPNIPRSQPTTTIHRPEWGTLGTLVLTAGDYPYYYSLRKWKKNKHAGWRLKGGTVCRPAPHEPRTLSLPVDNDPRNRPIVITICGRSYIIRGDKEPGMHGRPDTPEPEPTPQPEPIPVPTPEPTAPAPDAPEPEQLRIEPKPKNPTVYDPWEFAQCVAPAGPAPYPPIDTSPCGPWKRDIELAAPHTSNPHVIRPSASTGLHAHVRTSLIA